jgi:hypothetical protein
MKRALKHGANGLIGRGERHDRMWGKPMSRLTIRLIVGLATPMALFSTASGVRAGYIYSFTGSDIVPGITFSGSFSVSDSVVATGLIGNADLQNATFSYTYPFLQPSSHTWMTPGLTLTGLIPVGSDGTIEVDGHAHYFSDLSDPNAELILLGFPGYGLGEVFTIGNVEFVGGGEWTVTHEPSVVPEPSTFSLTTAGMAACAVIGWGRKARKVRRARP